MGWSDLVDIAYPTTMQFNRSHWWPYVHIHTVHTALHSTARFIQSLAVAPSYLMQTTLASHEINDAQYDVIESMLEARGLSSTLQRNLEEGFAYKRPYKVTNLLIPVGSDEINATPELVQVKATRSLFGCGLFGVSLLHIMPTDPHTLHCFGQSTSWYHFPMQALKYATIDRSGLSIAEMISIITCVTNLASALYFMNRFKSSVAAESSGAVQILQYAALAQVVHALLCILLHHRPFHLEQRLFDVIGITVLVCTYALDLSGTWPNSWIHCVVMSAVVQSKPHLIGCLFLVSYAAQLRG